MQKTNIKKTFLSILTFSLVAAFGYYFYSEFKSNIDLITDSKIETDYGFIALAGFITLIAYLLITQAWLFTLNTLSKPKLSYLDGLAALNLPSLAKYIPGKLWSYAIQTYWLNKHGFSKSIVVYSNLLNVGISIGVSALIGLTFFVLNSPLFSATSVVLSILALALGDLIFVWQADRVFNYVIYWFNRVSSRKIDPMSAPRSLLVKLQVYYFCIYLIFGIAGWLMCIGIGYPQDFRTIGLITVSFAVADSIGFLAIIVPGGLGVREGVMYGILNQVSGKGVSLILPVATRVIMMIAEILLAVCAVIYLKSRKDFEFSEIKGAALQEENSTVD